MSKTVLSKLDEAIALVREQRAQVLQNIAATQAVRDAAQAEHDELLGQPVSFEDAAGDYLRRWIELRGQAWSEKPYWVSFANERIGAGFKCQRDKSMASWERLSDYSMSEHLTHSLEEPRNIFALLCRLFPEQVHAHMAEVLTERAGEQWGATEAAPVAERRARVAELAQKVQTCEARLSELGAELARIDSARLSE